MNPEPDFDTYSEDELIDVYENIDRENYPERFKKVMALLGIKDPNTEITEYIDEVETLGSNPIIKAKRINDFFDSLSDSGSGYHSGDFGCGGSDGGGDGGGGE
jgi:hypothetical protein